MTSTPGSAIDGDVTTTDDTLLLAVLMMSGIGLLFSPARRWLE